MRQKQENPNKDEQVSALTQQYLEVYKSIVNLAPQKALNLINKTDETLLPLFLTLKDESGNNIIQVAIVNDQSSLAIRFLRKVTSNHRQKLLSAHNNEGLGATFYIQGNSTPEEASEILNLLFSR